MQRTIRHSVELEGTGLHSGARTRLRIEPAAPHHGLVFRRSDITDGRSPLIAARYSNVDETTLHTRICNDDGVKIATVEHVLAAIAGCGIHNAVIEVDGPEVPIFDGSSRDIVQALLNAGIETQSAPLQALQIQREVAVSIGEATARLVPADGFFIDASIEFDEAAIGRQSRSLDMANGAFLRELSDCRTFCRQGDVDAMRAQGLALGGSYYNAVVVDGDRVISPGGMRRADECVRHKMLDVLGDLALAGLPILGRYIGHRPGHALSNALLHKVFATPFAAAVVTLDAGQVESLPGMVLTQDDLAAVG